MKCRIADGLVWGISFLGIVIHPSELSRFIFFINIPTQSFENFNLEICLQNKKILNDSKVLLCIVLFFMNTTNL